MEYVDNMLIWRSPNCDPPSVKISNYATNATAITTPTGALEKGQMGQNLVVWATVQLAPSTRLEKRRFWRSL